MEAKDLVVFRDFFASVFDLLDLISKIRLISCCHYFYASLKIMDVYDIENKYLSKIDYRVLKQNKFNAITKLNVVNNRMIAPPITDIIHSFISFKMPQRLSFTTLRILRARGNCGVKQSDIAKLDLFELDVYDNPLVNDASHLKNLKKLNAGGACGIKQAGILGLDLLILKANGNQKITDASFLINLVYLSARGACGIDQNGITGLNLRKLKMGQNKKIKFIGFMTILICLDISYSSVGQDSLTDLRLTFLDARGNEFVHDLTFMHTLKRLNAGGYSCGISQGGIKGLSLTRLNISYNLQIYNLNDMKSLEELHAVGPCGLNQKGIEGINPICLNICNNRNIHDLTAMTNLKMLDISGRCAVDDAGIKGLDLSFLDSRGNRKVDGFDFAHKNPDTVMISDTVTISDK